MLYSDSSIKVSDLCDYSHPFFFIYIYFLSFRNSQQLLVLVFFSIHAHFTFICSFYFFNFYTLEYFKSKFFIFYILCIYSTCLPDLITQDKISSTQMYISIDLPSLPSPIYLFWASELCGSGINSNELLAYPLNWIKYKNTILFSVFTLTLRYISED